MANKALFSQPGRHVAAADTTNHAGGKAYSKSDHEKLAQLASTGTFNDTFYVGAADQLKELNALLPKCDYAFIAKTAIYARQVGFMKDMPAYLAAWLFVAAKTDARAIAPAKAAFALSVDNAKQLRTFVQLLRSGQILRSDGKPNKSVASAAIKKTIQQWFYRAKWHTLINGSVGNDPSLADVLRIVHPKPRSEAQDALFSWIRGDKEGVDKTANYPDQLKELMAFRAGTGSPPNLDFRLLIGETATKETWTAVARNAGWQMLRMNLNTFQRQGVLEDPAMVDALAAKLRDPESVRKSRAFPYQLLTAYMNAKDVPAKLRNALQDAMEIALENVPAIPGKVVVAPDVSGSMTSPATGNRGTATTATRCIDIAALVASAILRKNEDTVIFPFDTRIHDASHLNSRDTVMTNAAQLAKYGGGGTNCSLPLAYLNQEDIRADLVFYISDNESWADRNYFGVARGSGLMTEWDKFKRRNPKAKLVLLDITPNTTSQATSDKDILRIGGFSDDVFRILPDFMEGKYGAEAWVEKISQISLDDPNASGE